MRSFLESSHAIQYFHKLSGRRLWYVIVCIGLMSVGPVCAIVIFYCQQLLLIVPSCICVYFRNWAKWKQQQQQRQQRDAESRQDRLIDDAGDDMMDIPDGELCVVCLLRRRRAAFIYCGHRVCCVTCAQQVEQGTNPRCPVCRQTVSGIVHVFDS